MNKETDILPRTLPRREVLRLASAAGLLLPFRGLYSPNPPDNPFTPDLPTQVQAPVDLAPSKPVSKEIKEVTFTSSVLTYHEVTKNRVFSDVMDLLSKGFKPISIQDFVLNLRQDRNIDQEPTFMVTFDDSRLSQYTQGLPALDEVFKQTGIFIPATLFAILGFVNDRGRDAGKYALKELPDDLPSFYDGPNNEYMTKYMLIDWTKRKYDIQVHAYTHPFFVRESPEDLLHQIAWPEKRNKEIRELAGVEDTGIRTIAWPYGSFGKREVDLVASRGYHAAFRNYPNSRYNSVFNPSLKTHSSEASSVFQLPRIGQT